MKFKKIIAITLAVMTIMSVMAISASAAVTRAPRFNEVEPIWNDESENANGVTRAPRFNEVEANGEVSTEDPWAGTVASPASKAEANCYTSGSIGSAESTGILGGVWRDPVTTGSFSSNAIPADQSSEPVQTAVNDNIKWVLTNGVLTLSGTGGTAHNASVLFDSNTHIETIVIEEGITYVAARTFGNLPNLKTVIVIDAATVCEHSFVTNCANLNAVIIGANLEDTKCTPSSIDLSADKFIVLAKTMEQPKWSGATVRNDFDCYRSGTLVIQNGKHLFTIADGNNYIEAKYTFERVNMVSYADIINMAKNALADVPASVLAKLPAELGGGNAGNQTSTIPSQFGDVASSAYYAAPVDWAVEQGITKGTSTTTFSPNATCTTAQILTMLYRAYGSPAVNISNPFTNVDTTAYFYDAARWAYSKGMINGGSFAANDPCTRASTVMFMWHAAGSPAITSLSNFTDVSPSASYAQAVAWALEQSVTQGTSATTFAPDTTCTRAQIVTFLWRDLAE